MWMVNSLVFLCLLSKFICLPSGVSGPDCKISTKFRCDGQTKKHLAICTLVLVVDGLSVNVGLSKATCKLLGTNKCEVIDLPVSSNDPPLCSIFKFKISLKAERVKAFPYTTTTLIKATVTADLPCPYQGHDINGPTCQPACPAGNPPGDVTAEECPCDNACFPVSSWEDCASQCNGVDTRTDLSGTHKMPYVAWSYISRGPADPSYARQCCCKNTLNGLVDEGTSIMGLGNCLGSGRLASN